MPCAPGNIRQSRRTSTAVVIRLRPQSVHNRPLAQAGHPGRQAWSASSRMTPTTPRTFDDELAFSAADGRTPNTVRTEGSSRSPLHH
jgi:hypothetical protein